MSVCVFVFSCVWVSMYVCVSLRVSVCVYVCVYLRVQAHGSKTPGCPHHQSFCVAATPAPRVDNWIMSAWLSPGIDGKKEKHRALSGVVSVTQKVSRPSGFQTPRLRAARGQLDTGPHGSQRGVPHLLQHNPMKEEARQRHLTGARGGEDEARTTQEENAAAPHRRVGKAAPSKTAPSKSGEGSKASQSFKQFNLLELHFSKFDLYLCLSSFLRSKRRDSSTRKKPLFFFFFAFWGSPRASSVRASPLDILFLVSALFWTSAVLGFAGVSTSFLGPLQAQPLWALPPSVSFESNFEI